MERVPTTKEELSTVVKKYRGHLIATTACMGGELSTNVLLAAMSKKVNDMNSAKGYEKNIGKRLPFGGRLSL